MKSALNAHWRRTSACMDVKPLRRLKAPAQPNHLRIEPDSGSRVLQTSRVLDSGPCYLPPLNPGGHSEASLDLLLSALSFLIARMTPNRRVTWQATSHGATLLGGA